METQETGHNYIYFLQYNTKLPLGYFHLAEGLSSLGITLLAIRPQDFLNIQDGKRKFVMSLAHDIQSQQALLDCKKKFLDFGVQSGNLIHLHFSSFGEAPPTAGISSARRPGGQYHFFALPLTIVRACKQAAVVYYKEKAKRESWPGGKRPKLSLGHLAKN